MSHSVLESFSVRQAAKFSGLRPAMVDYLCRQKVLVPGTPGRRGRGCPRKYSFGDVVMLRVLAQLLKAGVSVERIKTGLKSLRKYHKDIAPDRLPAQYLVTDGRRVYLKDTGSLNDLDGSGQTSFLFVLELGHAQREVHRAAMGG